MEKLIGERMAGNAGCARLREHLDLAIDCTPGWEMLINISMARVRWAYKGALIVGGSDISTAVAAAVAVHLVQVRFHCRCDKDYIVGSLVA